MLIVLTGKTASGKDTIKNQLLVKYPALKKVITTTSRTPRDGEKDGIDYHFLPREDFEQKIKSGEFAEFVEYGGNLYGTYKIELQKAFETDLIWRIDPSRAGEVREFIKRSYPSRIADELIQEVVVIYITVADRVVLQRLRSRGLGEIEINRRMQDDAQIWQQDSNKYDFVVENEPGKLSEAVNKVIDIINEH